MPREVLSNLPVVIFIIALLAYSLGAFVIMYHLIRFGIGTKPKVLAFIFFSGSVVLIMISGYIFFSLPIWT